MISAWWRNRSRMAADFVGIFAGLSGHSIDQFEVAHDRESPGKREHGQGKRPAARRADGETEHRSPTQRAGRRKREVGKRAAAVGNVSAGEWPRREWLRLLRY